MSEMLTVVEWIDKHCAPVATTPKVMEAVQRADPLTRRVVSYRKPYGVTEIMDVDPRWYDDELPPKGPSDHL